MGLVGKSGWPVQGWGGSCNFYIKNKIKSEIFNDKESVQTKIFFSVMKKNSNWGF